MKCVVVAELSSRSRDVEEFGVRRLLVVVAVSLGSLAGCANTETTEFARVPNGGVESSAAAPLPVPRTEVAGAVLGGRIVVVGGLLADGRASDLVDIYDPSTDEWTAGPALPLALHHMQVVSAGGRVWVVGGFTAGADNGWVESARVLSLGVGEARWRDEPSLPEARGALGAAATGDGAIVAFGGVVGGAVAASSVVLRSGSSSWEAGPALSEPREHLAAATIDGRVLAIAGRVGSLQSNKRSVESWNSSAADQSWRRESSLTKPRGGIAAAGRCVAGGEEPEGTISSIECVDGAGTWSIVAYLKSPRHGLAVVDVDGRLHVIAGGAQPGLHVSGTHEVFDLGASRP